jgi:hypothetical protein
MPALKQFTQLNFEVDYTQILIQAYFLFKLI